MKIFLLIPCSRGDNHVRWKVYLMPVFNNVFCDFVIFVDFANKSPKYISQQMLAILHDIKYIEQR